MGNILGIFSVFKSIILGVRYFLEIKNRGQKLDQIYGSQDREEKIHLEIEDSIRRKDEARKTNNKSVVDYYSSRITILRRKLRNQQKISGTLEGAFGDGD